MPEFLLHQTLGPDSQASSASSKSWCLCGTWNKQFSFQTGLLIKDGYVHSDNWVFFGDQWKN